MRAAADFIDQRGHNAAMQDAGISLEMIRRHVFCLDHTRFHLIHVQVRAYWIFHATDEAVTRIRLFYSGHGRDYTLGHALTKSLRLSPDTGPRPAAAQRAFSARTMDSRPASVARAIDRARSRRRRTALHAHRKNRC